MESFNYKFVKMVQKAASGGDAWSLHHNIAK